MHDLLLKDEISDRFDADVSYEQYGLDDVDTLSQIEPNILHEIGAQAWMLYIESGADADPQSLSEYFDSSDPLLFQQVENVIGEKVIYDLSFSIARVDDPNLGRDICCKLLLCHMWPGMLYLADVEFSNPYEPVSEDEQRYNFHEYRSLGLFASQLRAIIAYCKDNDIHQISLTTASNDQIPYFESHGFKVLNNAFSEQALKYGMSVPMILDCT